jgi:hypothetical protein
LAEDVIRKNILDSKVNPAQNPLTGGGFMNGWISGLAYPSPILAASKTTYTIN